MTQIRLLYPHSPHWFARAITEDPPDGISASLEDDADLCVGMPPLRHIA
jgi:hypothetical protein